MSEFRYVGFRAIDGPLSDRQLEYMECQSTRAEITTLAVVRQRVSLTL